MTIDHFQEYMPELDVTWNRNTRDMTGTGATQRNRRPDFLCYAKGLLIFKGEEKADERQYEKAQKELLYKFGRFSRACFGDIQFMICYAAAGYTLGFYAIGVHDEKRVSIHPLTDELYLRRTGDRLKAFIAVINIMRVIRTILPGIPVVYSAFRTNIIHDGTTIYFMIYTVRKTIANGFLPYTEARGMRHEQALQNRLKVLKGMYDAARGCPNLVQAVVGEPMLSPGGKYIVTMTTTGITEGPKNREEVKAMTRCVLTGLVRLHQNKYVHRDVRLPNIIKIPDQPPRTSYVLIDFEHGGKTGQKGLVRLKDWDDGTLTNGSYDELSDLYQLGKLLKTELDRYPSSDDQHEQDFVTTLKSKSQSAYDMLRHPWLMVRFSEKH